MPINPNIALGVQQQQPVNMLGQMGQMMALRAAQQEMEGSEGVKSYFARPSAERGDPTDLMQYGRQGRETLKALNESQIKQLEADQKRVTLVGAGAGAVLNNPTMETFTTVVSDLVKRGIYTPEQRDQAFATIGNDPSKIKSFVQPIFDQAISAEKRLADITSRRNQDVASGASYGQLALAQQKYQDQLAAGGDIITSLVKDPETGQDVEMQFRRNLKTGNFEPVVLQPPSMRVDISPNSATSSYQPSGAGGTPNVLATQVAPQSGAAPATSINGLIQAPASASPTFGRPKQTIRQPVAVIKDGVVTLVPPEQAVGMTPATPGAEKALEKTVIAKEGKESVNRVLGTLHSEYSNLVKSGGITDTRRSTEENIAARTGASGVGQLTGSFTGSEAQSFRDTIEQTRPLLLTAIMKATGLSATQLNSNVELQTYLKTATDPKVSIQSNVKALNNISTMFGIGEKFEVPEIKTSKSANPADAPPAGLSPEIAKLWQYMPAEDRKLWLK